MPYYSGPRSPGPSTFERAWGVAPRRIAFSQVRYEGGSPMATCEHVVCMYMCWCQVVSSFSSRRCVLCLVSSFYALYHPCADPYYPLSRSRSLLLYRYVIASCTGPPSSPAVNAGWVAGCVARGPCMLGRVIRARGCYRGCMERRLVARGRSAERAAEAPDSVLGP